MVSLLVGLSWVAMSSQWFVHLSGRTPQVNMVPLVFVLFQRASILFLFKRHIAPPRCLNRCVILKKNCNTHPFATTVIGSTFSAPAVFVTQLSSCCCASILSMQRPGHLSMT